MEGKSIKATEDPEAHRLDPADAPQTSSLDLAILTDGTASLPAGVNPNPASDGHRRERDRGHHHHDERRSKATAQGLSYDRLERAADGAATPSSLAEATSGPPDVLKRQLQALRHLHRLLVELKKRSTVG